MYQYINATGVINEFGARPKLVDISTMPLLTVFRTYEEITVTLLRLSDNKEVYLDLYKLPAGLRMSSQTLPQWLILNANNTLPTEDIPIDPDYTYVKYANLWRMGASVKLTNRQYHPDMDLSEDICDDVLITLPNASHQKMVQYGLFTVNGYLHQADYNDRGVVVFDANRTKKQSLENGLGYLNFSDIGAVHYCDITDDMVYSRTTKTLNDALYIKLPFHLANRVVMLSLAGRLHYVGGILSMVGDNTLKVDFTSVALDKLYYQDKDQIDLSSLEVPNSYNGSQELSYFYTDEYIRKLLALPQSFLVVVDTNELRSGRIDLDPTGLQGRWTTSLPFRAPVIDDEGRLREYTQATKGKRRVIQLYDYLRVNRVLDTTRYLTASTTANPGISFKPYEQINAYFWILSKTRGL